MLNACTVIAKNYVAFARVLARSLSEHHPDARLTTLVVDDYDGWIDPAQEPFDVLSPADIGLPEFLQMASWYEILELTTAVKPWLLRHLLGDADHVVYLDPDIRFYGPCPDLAAAARDHGVVLTPHNVGPMPRDGRKPSEQDILIAGSYNLGFLGLGRRESTQAVLDWWSERLLTQCVVDPERGLFVDQRWMDFVPGMVEDHVIVRDPGLNVAYWNLGARTLRGADGTGYDVDGAPLRFFHFSGFNPLEPDRLSKHQDRVDLRTDPPVAALCSAYAQELLDAGYATAIEWPYTYACSASGRRLDRATRRLFLAGVQAGQIAGTLFDAEGEADFDRFAAGPAEGADRRITRYLKALHEERPDLRAAFPSLYQDVEGLLQWARDQADGPLSEVRHLLGGLEPAPTDARPTDVPPAPPRLGVNLVGYLRAELGVGEVARQVVQALDAAEVPVLPHAEIAYASRQGHEFSGVASGDGAFAVNLLCVNADQTPAFGERAGPSFFAGRHTIGWWWWEVTTFPQEWQDAFRYVDEVWAGSRYVADALRAVSPVPVLRMPLPIAPRPVQHRSREELGLPEGFLFLFSFDFHSVFARKNPLDLVEAYKRAFDPGDGTVLVLKAINGDAHPERRAALAAAIGERRDIVLLDRYVSASEKDSLLAACDCYASLHRAEGFGIGMAEAMLLEKPVVATGYSGNLDFMTDANSFLVRHDIVPIGPDAAPYPPEGEWAQPDVEHAASLLRSVFDDQEAARQRARQGREDLLRNHSPVVAGRAMRERLEEITPALTRYRAELAASALDQTLRLTQRGVHPSARAKVDPRRVARAGAVRATQPVLRHTQEVDRALAFALQRTADALRAESREATAMAEAARLGSARAVTRIRDDLREHLEALEAHARRTDRRMSELAELLSAAHAEPFMSLPFEILERPGAGSVLGFSGGGGVDHPGYHGFEDVFRGSEEMIRERQRAYVPLVREHAPVLDAGCGRGEMLDLLRDAGVRAAGVDLDAGLVEHCRQKGHLDVQEADAVAWLEQAQPATLGAVFSAQVVEHLDPEVLERFITAARSALRAGGLLIMETVNPHNPRALKAFWVDPSHRHPLFPEVLLQLVRDAGFAEAYAFCPYGTGDWETDRRTNGEYAVVATAGAETA